MVFVSMEYAIAAVATKEMTAMRKVRGLLNLPVSLLLCLCFWKYFNHFFTVQVGIDILGECVWTGVLQNEG